MSTDSNRRGQSTTNRHLTGKTTRNTGKVAAAREPETVASLRRSLATYQTLVDLCHAAVISANANGRITSWNPAASELFGYAADEILNAPITRLIPPRLHRKHRSGFKGLALRSGKETIGKTLRGPGLRKDGTEVAVEVSVAAGRQGADLVFTAVVRDITEQHEVVEKLNDALQRLQFHFERMPLAYIVWDTGFRVVEWNAAAERIFGYTRAEAVGKHAYDLVVPEDTVQLVEDIWANLLAGDTSSHSINANVRKDGSKFTCEWFNTPLRDSAGTIRGVASMGMDCSEREATHARLRDTQKLESLGVLAGGVAHDFNSALMVILGNTALLRSIKGLPSRAIEHIELIEDAGLRANDFIKHLLAYARTGRHNPQPTNLNEVIHNAIRFVRSSVGRGQTLNVALADRIPTILADHSQIEQVLLNLCLNAVQALTEPGTITLSTRVVSLSDRQLTRCIPSEAKPGRYVELVVRDTGSGMTPDVVQRVFDPFFTTKSSGHGLGLAAVLGILRQHHGLARVESCPGKGTAIHVFFPVRKPQRKETKTRQPPARSVSRRVHR